MLVLRQSSLASACAWRTTFELRNHMEVACLQLSLHSYNSAYGLDIFQHQSGCAKAHMMQIMQRTMPG